VSAEATIVCDGCGCIIDAGKTAGEARRNIRETGGRVNLPGGKDLCASCVTEGRQPE
jgi:hypothetical protein